MSGFTTRLEVSPREDGRHWRLTRTFPYDIGSKGSGRTITVPAGFETDFASFPRFIWRFLMWWLPGWAKYSKPPVIHDYLYQSKGYRVGKELMVVTRKYADVVFLEAMLVAWRKHPSGKAIAWMEYAGVRAFGWLAWRGPAVAVE